MILTDFSVQTKILTARRIFCFASGIRVRDCNHKQLQLQSTLLFFFFQFGYSLVKDFYFLICFACVYINVKYLYITLFQYQGNNICNKLAITLIFMGYVYNLECLMCLEGEKKPHKYSQILSHHNKIQNKTESIKYDLFMSTIQ